MSKQIKVVGFLAISIALVVTVFFLPRHDEINHGRSGDDTTYGELTVEVQERVFDALPTEKNISPVAPHAVHTIQFADGEEMRFPWELPNFEELRREQLIDNILADNDFGELWRLAQEGNGTAAYAIYKQQQKCMEVPETSADLEKAVIDMYQTYQSPISMARPWHLKSDTDPERNEKSMRRVFSLCEIVREERFLEPADYLRMAADYGTYPATSEYGWSLFKQSNKDSAEQYFERAWLNGDEQGAQGLGMLYRDGSDTIQPDRIAGYAYTYIGMQLQISRYSTGKPGDAMDYVRKEVERISTEILSEYDIDEVEQGTELAKVILADYVRAQML